MIISKDPKVSSFIQELNSAGSVHSSVVLKLYELFSLSEQEYSEKFIYGGIGLYIDDSLVGGIYVSAKHVSLVFSEGYKLEDKYSVLEGGGKYRRHIKLSDTYDIGIKNCAFYIRSNEKLYSS